MLVECWLYSVLNSGSPTALLDFIVQIYEILKRVVDVGLLRSQKKRVKTLFENYFLEHGLDAEHLVMIRDAYVHRGAAIGDLYEILHDLPVSAIMSYVSYFGLEISEKDIALRLAYTLEYLHHLCELFGYATYGASTYGGRYQPWK